MCLCLNTMCLSVKINLFFDYILQLSILVHPDKNQDDAERAQKAFEGISMAFLAPAGIVAPVCSVGF